MLTILLFVGAFFGHTSGDFLARVLTKKDGVVTGIVTNSVLLSLPPCKFKGQNVSLKYSDTNTNWTLVNIFEVPSSCENNITGSDGDLVTRNIGYKVSDLDIGETYKFQFQIGSEVSNELMVDIKSGQHYSAINTGLPARSGAMIVITVILSVAMFILLVALTITIVMSNDDD